MFLDILILSSATPVFGRGRGKPVNVPDHPPPPGYLCYRCREKGMRPSVFLLPPQTADILA
jgi:hypothetical protein